MDNRTVLQIPMDSSLRTDATSVAVDLGFSSLQEAVRVLLTKLANKQLTISVEETITPFLHEPKKDISKWSRILKPAKMSSKPKM